MNPRLARQSFLGADSDEVLGGCRVGVIGLGGGGSHIVQQLAHVGIGNFTLFDHDCVEDHNLNRLVGATAEDVAKRTLKTAIAARLIVGINPAANIVAISKRWEEDPLRLRECDVVFGCVDTYSARNEIERACRRFLIPYIDLGMDVTTSPGGYVVSGQVILSMPGEPCLWCLGFLNESVLTLEAKNYGAAGGRPQVVWANGILASAAVGIFVQLVTPWHHKHRPVEFLEYDGNGQRFVQSNRLEHMTGGECRHFPDPPDLGDPFWPI